MMKMKAMVEVTETKKSSFLKYSMPKINRLLCYCSDDLYYSDKTNQNQWKVNKNLIISLSIP
jgi:hypothetical protein